MSSPFRKNLLWSFVAHLGLLLAVGLAVAFAPVRKPPETVQWMDLASDLGAPPPAPSPAPAEPSSPPEPPPAPSPPEPEPPTPQPEPPAPPPPPAPDVIAPKPPPKKNLPKPKATERSARPRVILQTNRVVRITRSSSAAASRAPAAKTSRSVSAGASYDPKAFARRLLSRIEGSEGLVTAKGGGGMGRSGQPNPFAGYFQKVFQEMYAAWTPPLGLDNGLVARVLIRVEKSGAITKVSLVASSGNRTMDDSALAAANRVKKLPPPPEDLGSPFAEIIVHFKIQRP